MRQLVGLILVVVTAGCSAATLPTAPPSPTPAPTATPTPAPSPLAALTPEPARGLSGQVGVTKAMTDPGSLGMTLPEFVDRWNGAREGSSYALLGAPERKDQTFLFTPDGAENTMILGVLNDDGTIRAVDALSVARGIADDIDRSVAELEAVSIWSVLGRAVNPRLTKEEGYLVLTRLGLQTEGRFGLLPPLVLDWKGVRYYIIEGDETTNLVARPSD